MGVPIMYLSDSMNPARISLSVGHKRIAGILGSRPEKLLLDAPCLNWASACADGESAHPETGVR